MSAILTSLFASLGRRFAYWGTIVAAVGVAVWILLRQGKHAAEADLAIRRAEARIRALQSSKDIHQRHYLGSQPTARASDGLSLSPPFAPLAFW